MNIPIDQKIQILNYAASLASCFPKDEQEAALERIFKKIVMLLTEESD